MVKQKTQVEIQGQNSNDNNTVFVGKKPVMAYVTAALVQLAGSHNVVLKARGLATSTAILASQILQGRMQGLSVKDVCIGSEDLERDGQTRSVCFIEIEMVKQ